MRTRTIPSVSRKPVEHPEKRNLRSLQDWGVLFSTWAFWIILFYFAAPSLPGWAIKNWSPTLFSESLGIPMSQAGPISTITIAVSSFIGVIIGGIMSDRWVQRNIRGRVYTGAIGLGMMIPALLLLGFGQSLVVGSRVRLVVRHWLWNVRHQQHAHPLPVRFRQIPRHGLRIDEHDGGICRSGRDRSIRQMDRRGATSDWVSPY